MCEMIKSDAKKTDAMLRILNFQVTYYSNDDFV